MIAIEVGISSLGLSHPETAKTIDGMGTTYLSDGQIKFALPYFLLAYKLLTGSLNQKHSDVMLVYNHLQIVHQKMEIIQPFENWLSIQLENSIRNWKRKYRIIIFVQILLKNSHQSSEIISQYSFSSLSKDAVRH